MVAGLASRLQVFRLWLESRLQVFRLSRRARTRDRRRSDADSLDASSAASRWPPGAERMKLTIGTKSVLFGAHQFLIHPWFVAWAWWRRPGVPFPLRRWVAYFIHDLGYVGQPNRDGPEGERHPVLGARLMAMLFDRAQLARGVHVP